MNNFNNKRSSNNRSRAPKTGTKAITKELVFVMTGKDQKGNKYDPQSCRKIMTELETSGCFNKLSVSLAIERNKLDKEAKGITNIGRILSYDTDLEKFNVLLFGKGVEYDAILDETMVVVPRVRAKADTGEVATILGFDIVNMSEVQA